MESLQKTLSLREGITLAIGSIIGSGILFLPSLTFKVAGNDVVVVWVVATMLCFPLLQIFSDMVKEVPSQRGIEGFVSLGLGRHVGSAIPLLFLGTVSIGMPSAAIIAGEYVTKYFSNPLFGSLTAYLLIALGVGANLGGVKVGGTLNSIVAALLFIMGAILVFLTTPAAIGNYHHLQPDFQMKPILAGVVVAFWAYAGFENLTFISGEFKKPKRDFFLSLLVALISCGLLYLVLSVNYASLVARDKIDSLAGLSQLATSANLPDSAALIITLFAVFAVAINLISWTWGISRLVYSSAQVGFLPKCLGRIRDSSPRSATILLGAIFFTALTFAQLFPEFFHKGLVIVSTNFVFIYVLCMVSYLVHERRGPKKLISGLMLIGLTWILSSSGWLVLYPLGLSTIAIGLSVLRSRR